MERANIDEKTGQVTYSIFTKILEVGQTYYDAKGNPVTMLSYMEFADMPAIVGLLTYPNWGQWPEVYRLDGSSMGISPDIKL